MIHTSRNPTRKRGIKDILPFLGAARLPAMGISGSIFLLIATLAAIWAASLYNYLLFHTIAEGFAITIAFGVFMLAWNSRRVLENNYLLLVGIAYAFIGAIDFVHTLAYPGMGVFLGYGPNLSTQLWIGARYMEALTLLAAPLALASRIRSRLTLWTYIVATALLIASVFGGVFPDCYIEGTGLTVFKITSEYIICILLAGAAVFLYHRRSQFDRTVLNLLIAAIGLTILSELSFTLYSDPYSFFNLLGHFLKVVSFYIIYKAVVVTGLARPYDLLYRRLSESEKRYRNLFSNMTEGFALHEIITDEAGTPRDYRFTEVNPAFENLTGLGQEKVVGRTMRDILPGTGNYWIETAGKVALTGEPAHIENYSAETGRWYEADLYQTEPGRFAVLFTDMTERKRAEVALRESEEKLALATSGTQIGIFDRNLVTGGIAATEQNLRLLGMPPAPAAASRTTLSQFYWYSDWAERVHPEDLPDVEAEMERCMAQHTPFESEYRVIWPDDSVHWLATRGMFQYDDEGQPLRLLGILMDITDRRQAEEKIREMNQELERRVAERTQQLRDLVMELSGAENRERERLAHVLHEELQQQLAAIKLRIDTLVPSQEATPAIRKRIQDTVSMVADAINETRSLSQELYPITLRMHGLRSAIEGLAEAMHTDHGLMVSLQLSPDADVRTERIGAILYQAVRELLFNVVKHSGTLEASVTVCRGNHDIRISVRDNGQGFNPDRVRGRVRQSTSLGLQSIEERIVYLGGRVEMEGEPGKGCCVTLVLPDGITSEEFLSADKAGEVFSTKAAQGIAAADAPESPTRERIQILLADDHDLMRESLASVLAKESDFEVIGHGSDGLEAVKLAIELAPDVVLMDVSMPGMTGIEATARIHEQFPYMVVIGLTMYSDPATGDRMREAGAVEILAKSGSIRQLCAAIREHGGRGAEGGETANPADQRGF